MFMTQNASVEAVAARTHRMERNGRMLGARRGISMAVVVKERVSVTDSS